DVPGSAIDSDECGNLAEAQKDVAVGQFRNAVAVCPLGSRIARRRDRILFRFHVLPRFPLPNGTAVWGALEQVVAVDRATGLFAAREPAAHAPRDGRRQRCGAQEQNIAVAQQPAVVVMVWLL